MRHKLFFINTACGCHPEYQWMCEWCKKIFYNHDDEDLTQFLKRVNKDKCTWYKEK